MVNRSKYEKKLINVNHHTGRKFLLPTRSMRVVFVCTDPGAIAK